MSQIYIYIYINKLCVCLGVCVNCFKCIARAFTECCVVFILKSIVFLVFLLTFFLFIIIIIIFGMVSMWAGAQSITNNQIKHHSHSNVNTGRATRSPVV